MRTLAAFLVLWAILAIPLPSQCGHTWLPGQGLVGASNSLRAATMWDPDGGGPAAPRLVVGGEAAVVGQAVANGIATRDPGTGQWSEFGGGMNNFVSALLALPNGDLIAGGAFSTAGGIAASNIARWNGAAWVALGAGLGSLVTSLCQLPNGDIVAGGWFAGGVARWNGSTWSTLGSGVAAAIGGARVLSLQTMPNGDIVAGGEFTSAGGVPARGVARWNGVSWSALPGLNATDCRALGLLPNGNLVAAGWFLVGTTVQAVIEWNGATWSPIGTLSGSTPNALLVLPNGDLIAGCERSNSAGTTLARWNGTAWATLGGGVSFATAPSFGNAAVLALALEPNGDIDVAGYFTHAGNVKTNYLARWNGATFAPQSTGTDDVVSRLSALPNGDVLAGGPFTSIEGVAAARIARWNGLAWAPLGAGTNGPVLALAVLANGDAIAGGSFTAAGGAPAANVARWNGASWSPLGSGTNGSVYALAELPNGRLVAAGTFTAAGGVPAAGIAQWDGAAWTPLGGGLGTGAQVLAVHVLPNGDLLAGGNFSASAGTLNSIARWNGTAWSGLGGGVFTMAFGFTFPGTVQALLELANGDLIIGGSFSSAGGSVADSIARWNGNTWSALPGLSGSVSCLVKAPDGDVIAGGAALDTSGTNNLQRWNGATWAPLVGDIWPDVKAMVIRRAGESMIAGSFPFAGNAASVFLARSAPFCPAGASPYGAGCTGSGGPVTLTALQEPWLGGTFRAVASGMPANALALGVLGVGQLSLGLPSILPQGVAGCVLLVSPDVWDVQIPAGGNITTQLPIPNSPLLVGVRLFHQVLALETTPSAGIIAAISSNGLTLTLGDF